MRNKLIKSVRYNEPLDMMYMDASGEVTKRRIKVVRVGEDDFQAYCHLRAAKRTFKINNILALVPVIIKESMVI